MPQRPHIKRWRPVAQPVYPMGEPPIPHPQEVPPGRNRQVLFAAAQPASPMRRRGAAAVTAAWHPIRRQGQRRRTGGGV